GRFLHLELGQVDLLTNQLPAVISELLDEGANGRRFGLTRDAPRLAIDPSLDCHGSPPALTGRCAPRRAVPGPPGDGACRRVGPVPVAARPDLRSVAVQPGLVAERAAPGPALLTTSQVVVAATVMPVRGLARAAVRSGMGRFPDGGRLQRAAARGVGGGRAGRRRGRAARGGARPPCERRPDRIDGRRLSPAGMPAREEAGEGGPPACEPALVHLRWPGHRDLRPAPWGSAGG